jgi:membrane protease YdiL (CAAX protease family)
MDQEYEHQDNQTAAPWGFWATIGFSLVIGAAYILIQTIVVVVFIVAAKLRDANFDFDRTIVSIESNGFCLAAATCVSNPFVIALTALFAKIRKTITVKQYLRLHRVGWKELGKWSLVVVLFVICHDTLIFLLGRPIVPDFMLAAYKTAYSLPLLWLALMVMAPLSEEIFFRGFLFTGIEGSRLGPAGAIIITTLAWSVMHLQYDIYSIAGLFVGGLLLGFARLRSNSIYPPIVMHALQNLIATIEVVVVSKMSGSGC